MNPAPSALTPDDVAKAKAAADTFLAAVARGDEATARSLLIVKEGETVDFGAMSQSTRTYQLGAATAEGAQVVVAATVSSGPGPDETRPLPIVLDRVRDAWRIDMAASVQRMLGGIDLQAMMKEMAEGLGNLMAKSLEAVGEGLAGLSAQGAAEAPASPPPSPPAAKGPAPKRPAERKKKKRRP